MSKNKVTFGFKNVHVAFMDKEVTDKPAWEKPKRLPGAVRWTPTPEGESSTFHADDMPYFVMTSNNGYTSEYETANTPDDILARMLGWLIDESGMLVEIADGKPEVFAIMGEVQGDKRNRRFVYYNCQANRPEQEKNTKGETIEVNTSVLSMKVSPIEISGKNVVKGDLELSESNKAIFDAFFNEVYLPVFGANSPEDPPVGG